ncbi:type III PLP-dependent enzyme [Vibrio salinus]|uniref:type III PLP-dependent enzyme n=1 Tax=Vibrio salinus TaxID=2899784 RepID=UPI001E60DD97|nr:type III PLP-dependent enzyme [Vibrio salinus]MCE0495418.1 type III PLP-dependent enzyme [Vibrio salinus]
MAQTALDYSVFSKPYSSLSLKERQWVKSSASQYGTPLLLLDCNIVRQQYRALSAALPGVILHFALKPLPHESVVRSLLEEGANFDLASTGEIDLVASLGVPPEQTIHTHPIKKDKDIQDALSYGCNVFVVDNINELEKFIPYRDRVQILIRLSFRNADVFADLSKKFGCQSDDAIRIMFRAKALGIYIKGLSFHVGSQTMNPKKYVEAINACNALMQRVVSIGLPALSTLDIGGGFPVCYSKEVMPIDEFCRPINQALSQLPETVMVLAEPGRFIVAPSVMSIASVVGQAQREGKHWYYLDDGIYGSFSGLMFDDADYPIVSLREGIKNYPSVLAGPTCDSIDVISENILLPKLKNGDLIVSRMMGAYTSATSTDFNFIKRAQTIVLNEQKGDEIQVV